MKTLGIDLSADPKKTAACSIDWDTHEVILLDRPASDEELVVAIGTADMAGIDVPLGWPDAFVEALVGHRAQTGWLPSEDPPADREPLRFRHTDLHVRRAGAQPLSVSTDRIGVAAMRGARIQRLAAANGILIDRSGTTGRVVEAYPAAALRSWGLPSAGYKRPPNAQVLADLVRQFTDRCGILAPPISSLLAQCDDDDFDAVICAFVARAAITGATAAPDPTNLATTQREGWIHVPTVSIEEIVS